MTSLKVAIIYNNSLLQLHIIFNFEEMRDEFSTGYFSFASWEILQISMFALEKFVDM